jgi:hypothetical protein
MCSVGVVIPTPPPGGAPTATVAFVPMGSMTLWRDAASGSDCGVTLFSVAVYVGWHGGPGGFGFVAVHWWFTQEGTGASGQEQFGDSVIDAIAACARATSETLTRLWPQPAQSPSQTSLARMYWQSDGELQELSYVEGSTSTQCFASVGEPPPVEPELLPELEPTPEPESTPELEPPEPEPLDEPLLLVVGPPSADSCPVVRPPHAGTPAARTIVEPAKRKALRQRKGRMSRAFSKRQAVWDHASFRVLPTVV